MLTKEEEKNMDKDEIILKSMEGQIAGFSGAILRINGKEVPAFMGKK